ncbi:MAG TPA: VCBS repeat-containing protein, partial [Candidatus Sumerlaeota bacterium]|nr:VCBS repeat-containing protein [Candidatus Sumerlaeota bacterium]
MMKKRFISILMMVVALTLFFSGAQASKILVPEIYDPQDASDDSLRTELLQWRPDDSPVWVVIHRSTSGAILPSTIASDFITDEEVYLALNRCLERWNKSGMDMEFRDIALYSDFLAGMNPAMPYGPTQVAFDRFNLISFIEPNETVPTGVFTATYRFYFTVDIDLSNYASIPDLGGGVIYNPLTDEIDVDFDNDGIMDISLPREEYKGGTILDTDVIFNSLYEGYALAPQDPNDITPEEQAEYLGRPDIESLMMRALGEMLGLPGIPMSLPVMGDWVEAGQYASSPWQKRELNFADRMLGALHYSEWAPSHKGPASSAKDDPCQDGGGRISGMVLDGRGYYGQSDIYIIPDIPVFVGTPRDDFYIGPDSVYSDRGIIDLVACTYTGINVNIPNGINAPDTILNSEYLFVGLPARDDYAVYIAPSAARSYLEQYRQYLPEIPDYPAEFYGGANPPNPGDGTARDLNTAGDGIIASRFIEVGYNDFGQYTAGVRVGPRLIFGHPFPGTSYSTVRITRDGVTRDFANLGQAFGPILKPMQVNDITNATTGTWLVDNVLEVTQNIEIVNYIGASGNPDMFRVRYTFRNMSIDDPIDVGLRIMMDTLLAERDNAPFVINGEQVRNERLYQGESLPDDYRVLDNLEFPTLQALGVLKHPALSPPSRFITAWWPDAFDSLYDYDAKGTFFSGTGAPTQDSAVVLFWDTQTLQPGQSVVCSTAYGFLRADTIPESGVPHSLTAPTPYDDYDYISEPVSVVAGQETGNIVVITNVAAAPAGYDDDGDDGDDDDDDDDDDDTARLFFLEDVSPKSGGNALPVDELFALGAAAGDIDNDGDLDIVLACGVINDSGPNSLINRILLNDGTGTFEDVTFGEDGNPGTADDRIPYDTAIVGSYHVNLADFNGDGWLDIFVSNFAAGVGGEVGAQNQLYTNIDVTGDGIPDGFFTDETSVRLPGILNSGPYYIVDQTTRSDVGDIDSDGDIDIIVSNQDRFSDGYGSSGIDPAATPPSNLGTLWFSERILINHVNDKNPARRGYYFTDETLGSDLRFGGNTVDELDRVPPLLPDHPQTTPGPGNDETDYSWTSQVVLAPFTSDAALDILVVNQSEIPHQYRYSGYNMLYDNVDVDGDLLPDGYFECINYARDFFITVSSYDSRPQTRQEPLWIGRPSGYPNHGQIPPAQNDRIPGVASNSQGAIVMDLNATGYREIITVQASENAIYFDPVNPGILSHPGASRSLYSIVGGSALEYVTPFTRIIQENRNVPDYVPGISGRRRAIAAADFNLNGALDLYICNDALGGDLGNVNAVPTYNQVLLNDTFGRFSDVTLEVLKTDPDPDISFYAVTADFDNDGDPDVLVCNTGEQNELFVNRVIDAPPNLEDPTDIPLYIDKTPFYLPPYFASASNPPFVYGYANISLN